MNRIYLLIFCLFSIILAIDAYEYEQNEKDTFVALMDSVRTHVSDSLIVDYVVMMDFYEEPFSSPEEYAYLFCWWIEHHLEECDESINLYLYYMFEKYPGKFQELDKYLNFISSSNREKIRADLCYTLSFEWAYRREDLPIFDLFIKHYPYFTKHDQHDTYLNIYNDVVRSEFSYRNLQ